MEFGGKFIPIMLFYLFQIYTLEQTSRQMCDFDTNFVPNVQFGTDFVPNFHFGTTLARFHNSHYGTKLL